MHQRTLRCMTHLCSPKRHVLRDPCRQQNPIAINFSASVWYFDTINVKSSDFLDFVFEPIASQHNNKIFFVVTRFPHKSGKRRQLRNTVGYTERNIGQRNPEKKYLRQISLEIFNLNYTAPESV